MTKFDREHQGTHICLVCNEPKEDRNHMFTCKASTAVKNQEKNLKETTESVRGA